MGQTPLPSGSATARALRGPIVTGAVGDPVYVSVRSGDRDEITHCVMGDDHSGGPALVPSDQ
jgi:hypothetical protein